VSVGVGVGVGAGVGVSAGVSAGVGAWAWVKCTVWGAVTHESLWLRCQTRNSNRSRSGITTCCTTLPTPPLRLPCLRDGEEPTKQ
jgi:hypothetical protein